MQGENFSDDLFSRRWDPTSCEGIDLVFVRYGPVESYVDQKEMKPAFVI